MTPAEISASRDRLLAEGFHPTSKAVRVHDQLLALLAEHEVNTEGAVASIEALKGECERLREALEFYRDADYRGIGFWDGIAEPGILQDEGRKARSGLTTTESEAP